MEIREAKLEDLKAIHAIYQHYVATSVASLQEDLPSLESMTTNFNRLQSIGMPFVVATVPSDGTVAGYAYGDTFNERSGYKHTAEDSVYIHPSYCGKGIAKPLLEAVFQRLKSEGKRVVIAKMSILPDAPTTSSPSCRLHMSFGFREVGRLIRVGYKLDTMVDVVMFQLDLDEGFQSP